MQLSPDCFYGPGEMTCEQILYQTQVDWNPSREEIGNAFMGFLVAACTRAMSRGLEEMSLLFSE